MYLYCANDPVNYVDPSGYFFDIAIDIVSVGWSAYDMVKDSSLKNAGFLAYDIAVAILPYVPASRTYKAIDSLVDFIKITSKSAKAAKGRKGAKIAYSTGTADEKALEKLIRKENRKTIKIHKRFDTYIKENKTICRRFL